LSDGSLISCMCSLPLPSVFANSADLSAVVQLSPAAPAFVFQVALPAKAAVAAQHMSRPTPPSAPPRTVLKQLQEGWQGGWFLSLSLSAFQVHLH
jgi:hypothetical protein